jgi:hypothetical protein
MGTIARGTKSATGTTNFAASTAAKASEVNTDLNTIVTAINGNLDNDNIKSGAGIEASKLNLGTISQNVEFTGTVTGVSTMSTVSFTTADLNTGVLTITGDKAIVEIRNNSGVVIFPDDIDEVSGNTEIDLSTFGTISGTWKAKYL